MKRAMIHYGGEEYVLGESAAEVQARVDAVLADGSGWLEVGFGRGALRPAYLHIAPGVPLAVIDADDPDENTTPSGAA